MENKKENKVPNANYRKDNIPKWINAYVIFMMLLLIARTVILYFEPSWVLSDISNKTNSDGLLIKSLASTQLMMAFLVFSAYGSQNSMFMVFGYMVSIVVNVQLLIILPYYLGFTNLCGLLALAILLLFVVLEFKAIVQLRKLTVLPFEK